MIHGEPKKETEIDGRHSPPPQGVDTMEPALGVAQASCGHFTANLLSVVPKEKPPLTLVGDVHGKIAIIIVSLEMLG